MKKRSARIKNLAINSKWAGESLQFSFPTDNKLIFKLFSLDAFPKGICKEGKGRCCWTYGQLGWGMGYDTVTGIKSEKTGNWYRTCGACDNERWVENPNPDNWYACDDNW